MCVCKGLPTIIERWALDANTLMRKGGSVINEPGMLVAS